MPDRGPRTSGAEFILLAALVVWGLFPLAFLLAYAAHVHAGFTGADGLIGADGVLGADQLQYLSWARDAASHGLTSDLFTLEPNGHVYLQPMFVLTGLLWRLGVSLQVAYLLWKPIAAVALFAAGVVWARRFFPEDGLARVAVIALSLFLYTPLAALFSWTQTGAGPFRFQLYLLGYELLAANKLWGYVPSALGVALVPVALLAVERGLDPYRERYRAVDPYPMSERTIGPYRRRERIREGLAQVRYGPLVVAALAAGMASWLHPWQGVTLVVIFVGLAAWRRFRHWPALILPTVGAAAPLGYYYLLSHTNGAWRLASQYEVIGRLPVLVLLAGLGPLAVVAIAGLRNPGDVVIEQALLLWIVACFVTYFANDAFAPHALQGLSFPLAVLMVRGWRRLRLPAVLGAVAVALVTIPGLAYDARKFANTAKNTNLVQYYLPQSDIHALHWVASSAAPSGGVLAPTPFAAVVPSQTGRAVWVGHGYWSRDYPARARQVDRLFRGHMGAAAAQAFVRSTGAAMLVADCQQHGNLAVLLKPLIARELHFGCARVYVLGPRGPASR
jgi:hypothetical protein